MACRQRQSVMETQYGCGDWHESPDDTDGVNERTGWVRVCLLYTGEVRRISTAQNWKYGGNYHLKVVDNDSGRTVWRSIHGRSDRGKRDVDTKLRKFMGKR